jgi:MinD-like ATPase involved in chromosome partitioning or flagellar assembly
MRESAASARQLGLVYTFYSYKGGVGRSMALANVGILMATAQHKVLLVDWDLEAPGLEVFFSNSKQVKLSRDATAAQGIVDLLEARSSGGHLDWRSCIVSASFFGSSLDVITAGSRTEDYRNRVQRLDWVTLYKNHDIGTYFDELREEWRQSYDFVLIDSRTGITDIGDVCTVILPDILVLLFVTNHQSIAGIRSVVARAREARANLPLDRNYLIGVPVPSRDERDREYDKAAEWHATFAEQFADLYASWLDKRVSVAEAINKIYIPYLAKWSFGEQLPVLETLRERTDPGSIGGAYLRLATLLGNRLDWSAMDAKATAADVAGARVEVIRAEQSAREAEESRLEAEQSRREAERTALEKSVLLERELETRRRVVRYARIAGIVAGIAVMGLAYWWYETHPTPERLVAQLLSNTTSRRENAFKQLAALDKDVIAPYVPFIAAVLKAEADPGVKERASMAFSWFPLEVDQTGSGKDPAPTGTPQPVDGTNITTCPLVSDRGGFSTIGAIVDTRQLAGVLKTCSEDALGYAIQWVEPTRFESLLPLLDAGTIGRIMARAKTQRKLHQVAIYEALAGVSAEVSVSALESLYRDDQVAVVQRLSVADLRRVMSLLVRMSASTPRIKDTTLVHVMSGIDDATTLEVVKAVDDPTLVKLLELLDRATLCRIIKLIESKNDDKLLKRASGIDDPTIAELRRCSQEMTISPKTFSKLGVR